MFPYSEDLLVTSGATQGLSMLSTLLFSPGDLAFVEDPTYFIALRMLKLDAGLKCVPSKSSMQWSIVNVLNFPITCCLQLREWHVHVCLCGMWHLHVTGWKGSRDFA